MDDWDDLRYFLAVARQRTLLAAARSLGVNQSTVARRVTNLEHVLGAQLFHRSSSGYVITDAGSTLLPRAEDVERATTLLMHEVSDAQGPGRVTITASEAYARLVLIPQLAGLRRRNPGIDLVVVASNRTLDLTRGEADIAIRFVPPEQGSLVCRKIASVQVGVFAARSYLCRVGRPDFDVGLRGHDVIVHDAELMGLQEARWWAQFVGDARVAMRTNTLSNILSAAVSGFGLAVLPKHFAQTYSGLVLVRDVPELPDRPVWLVHASGRAGATNPHVRAVIDLLLEEST